MDNLKSSLVLNYDLNFNFFLLYNLPDIYANSPKFSLISAPVIIFAKTNLQSYEATD